MATIPWVGVAWFPPKGINTVFAPIVLSNFSTKPFCEQIFKSDNAFSNFPFIVFASQLTFPFSKYVLSSSTLFTCILVVCFTPFVSKNALFKLTIVWLFQVIFKYPLSVTVATWVASKFSSLANDINLSLFSLSIATAILSWDSDMASSVPSNPSYFLGTKSKFMSKLSAISPIATLTPPAPKSLHLFIICATSLFLKNLWIFLSLGASPFWTSAEQVFIDSSLCSLDEPVAPPQPSLPVLPPRRMIISPATGLFLITFSFGAAAITAPTSILFATKSSSYTSATWPVVKPIWLP